MGTITAVGPSSRDGKGMSILKTAVLHVNHWLLQIVMAMSDQQLVTGLAIVISGYARLQCGISFYHWKLITMLAWFSSVVHLATLLFLQDYLQRNRQI